MEESTRPDYVIPVGSADGVWAMMKKVGRFRGEGWLALWKGPYSGHATHSNAMLSLGDCHAYKKVCSLSV
jgi:hypothetical protein